MKPLPAMRDRRPSRRRNEWSAAFTLPNLMISMTLLLLVLSGLIASHLFGLRMYELTRAKLGASDEARAAIGLLVEEIRAGKIVRIGSGNLSNFTEIPVNTLQEGSAIQIHATTDTNEFTRYFWDSSDNVLKRTTNNATSVSVVARSITNNLVFRSEDFQGNVLTNNQNNRVISLTLQFFQLQYPAVAIGPGNYFDYYQLRTRITRRTLE